VIDCIESSVIEENVTKLDDLEKLFGKMPKYRFSDDQKTLKIPLNKYDWEKFFAMYTNEAYQPPNVPLKIGMWNLVCKFNAENVVINFSLRHSW
jgi:hypothetical protein